MEGINPQNETGANEKIETLRSLVEGEPQVFFILVGAMKYTEQKGRYESGAFADADENSKLSTGAPLATGGKDRMLAAAELHTAFPDSIIVPMSKTRDETKPTYAQVTHDELVHKGVKPEQIIREEDSVSTITEYKEVAKMWQDKGWDNIAFVTSNWHLPRSKALLNYIENFAENEEEAESLGAFAEAIRFGQLNIQFIGSTEVLKIRSKHYNKLFAELDDYSGIQERIAVEKKALEQIHDGEYGGKALSKEIGMDLL